MDQGIKGCRYYKQCKMMVNMMVNMTDSIDREFRIVIQGYYLVNR